MSETTEKGEPKSLEQKRAVRAWKHVEEIVQRQSQGKLGENYRSIVRKAPAMIKTNGLGQTLAFLLAKEEKSAQKIQRNRPEKAEGYLYTHLEDWLLSEEAPIAWPTPQGEEASSQDSTLIGRVMDADSVVYRQATQEALTYLGWLKRFAEACLQKGSEGG